MAYEVREYQTENGRIPFREWLESIRDIRARTRLVARIDRAAHGNFGDWKSITNGNGLCELRDFYGPGYRIYYKIIGDTVMILLAGSDKDTQERTIAKAKEYLADFERRQ